MGKSNFIGGRITPDGHGGFIGQFISKLGNILTFAGRTVMELFQKAAQHNDAQPE
mgnify:CR=1 FL=1